MTSESHGRPGRSASALSNQALGDKYGFSSIIDQKREISATAALFSEWVDRQQWPETMDWRITKILHYLKMAARKPLPVPLLEKLKEHVEAIATGR